MKVSGLIHTFPKEIKLFIATFLVVLSIGFFTGLLFVNQTSSASATGIEQQYLGNELDEDATVMKFKKSEQEMLTLVHGHVLSMSIIFFLLGGLLSATSINKKLKLVLMIEPFISIVLTFGGLYFLWSGVLFFKYVVMLSGFFMTLSFALSVLIIGYQLSQSNKNM